MDKSLLTIKNDKIIVLPIDRHEFIAYPLTNLDGTIGITEDEYNGIINYEYQFNEQLNGIEEVGDEE